MAIEPLTPERRRQQTRHYLLSAAAEVFAARGFHGASIDEVAAAAGFTKGAVYSNFKNKADLFLALIEANFEQDMEALRATLESSEIPPEARLSDFVTLIRDQTERVPYNWGTLYQEFCLYAMRNPKAREKVAEFDAMVVRGVAELIVDHRRRRGLEPLESAEHVARVIEALFRGIGLMRALDPEAVDEAFLQTAMTFVARALGVDV